MATIDELIDSKLAARICEIMPIIVKAVAKELQATTLIKGESEDSTQLLTETEAAKMCGMSVSWLALGRSKSREKYEEGKGRQYVPRPPYVKIGRRVRYPLAGVLEWQRTYTSGNQQND